jgi:aryl-alcohol dehydrogenase-like predicted oxidoreductase
MDHRFLGRTGLKVSELCYGRRQDFVVATKVFFPTGQECYLNGKLERL